MQDYLDRYIRKRNFAKTPEPGIDLASDSINAMYVVHRHDARNLHYDLRIAYGGRLICFAVPKGFSYDPATKHLAVHTEDHPLAYIGFEGIIPKGEYGAGSMTIWDAGSYRIVHAENPDAAVAKGEVKIILSGKKLRGEWHIVKLKSEKDEWLLFKAKDAYGKISWDNLFTSIDLSEQPETPMPELVTPMKHKSVSLPFSDPAWGFEILFEGYRVFCFKNGNDISFKNADGLVPENEYLRARLTKLAEAAPGRAVFDGLVVAVDGNGLPSKTILDGVLSEKSGAARLFYYMLDIVYFEDYDVRSLRYAMRKSLLSLVMSDNDRVLYVDYEKEKGELFAQEAGKAGVATVIAKALESPYDAGVSDHWKLIPLGNPGWSGAAIGRIIPKRIEVKITNPDKLFFPELAITKKDLVAYYNDVADFILPYLSGRIVHINRFPDGIYGESFYQKHLADPPDYIELITADDKTEPYFVCNNKAGLLYLANLGTIDFHSWFSRIRTIEHPDWIAWDLDPKGAPFSHVMRLAKEIGKIVRGIELVPFVKTSGKSGLHILAPIQPAYTYDQTRMFAESIARIVVGENGKIATVERNVELRGGRVYIDFLQNRRGQTLVPPYSARPVAAGSVSMPLEWEELEEGLTPEMFHIKNALERISKQHDPFTLFNSSKKDLAVAIGKLEGFYLKTRELKDNRMTSD
jgi:DNA ligase D-like protein (predicted polymerase)/DNA ligase D-like protein (predicted 3'-phosphoesterase)